MASFKKIPLKFPLLQDLKVYDRQLFKWDLLAGLTVGVVLIPQALAYAMLAGLPAIYGLYAAIFPLVIYALMGTSRQLSMGPAALLSLLIVAGVSQLAKPGSAEFIQWAMVLAFMVGLLQFLLGIFHLGFLVNFLSTPVISGFTSASALIIMTTQASSLMGVDLGPNHHFPVLIRNLFHSIQSVHGVTILVGGTTLAGLLMIRRVKRNLPGALFAILYGILITEAFHLDQQGLAVLGDIPRGLPIPILPLFSLKASMDLLPSVLSISLMGFVISIAVARAVPTQHRRERLVPDQELVAQGLANLTGSFFHGFPVAGSFARTAVNYQAGANTGVASIISAAMVLLTVLLLTPLFRTLPLAVLGAIIVVAVSDLFQWRAAWKLFKTDRRDLLMLTATFATTLFMGMETGIITGVVLSLSALIYSSSRPHYAVLGRLPSTTIYKNIDRFEEAEEEEGVLIIRPDARLYFGNKEYVREIIEKEVAARPETELIILDAVSISAMDSTAVEMMKSLQQDLLEEGIRMQMIGLIGPVRDILQRNGMESLVGSNQIYTRIHDVVLKFREETEGLPSPRSISIRPKVTRDPKAQTAIDD